MTISSNLAGVRQYLQAVLDLETRIVETQVELFDRVAAEMTEAVRKQRRIFVFGTGHSHLMAEESFYRAGGLAAAVPIFLSGLMLHENPHLSGKLERAAGLAGMLLEQYHPEAGEILFVFSNSGVNQMPVEMALEAKQHGLTTVGVCSQAYARQAPLSPLGMRLDEIADYSFDNFVSPGDAMVPLEGTGWRVAPGSTIAAAFIWNSLVAEVSFRLQAAGETVPAFISFNMPGAEAHNRELFATWAGRNPHLKGWE